MNFTVEKGQSRAFFHKGEMLEWLKRHAWKACKLQKGFRGSNPRLSAKIFSLNGYPSLLEESVKEKSFEQGASGSLWGLRRNPRRRCPWQTVGITKE